MPSEAGVSVRKHRGASIVVDDDNRATASDGPKP